MPIIFFVNPSMYKCIIHIDMVIIMIKKRNYMSALTQAHTHKNEHKIQI